MALETLGLALDARSIAFYRPTPEPRADSEADRAASCVRFERAESWPPAPSRSPDGLREPIERCLPRAIDGTTLHATDESALRSGEPVLWPGSETLARRRTASSCDEAQHGARERAPIWLVPCASGSGALFGLFGVAPGLGRSGTESELRRRAEGAAQEWHVHTQKDGVQSRWLARAETIGRLLAQVLECEHLARERDVLQERLSRQDGLATLGRVAASVAHDFNNVLTAIVGYAELLELELEVPGGRARGDAELAEIRAAAERASGLVEEVLHFGRPQASATGRHAPGVLVRRFEGMLRRILAGDVRLVLDLEPACDAPTTTVRIDPVRLERVILNLASNAREACARRVADAAERDERGRSEAARLVVSTRLVDYSSAPADPEGPGRRRLGQLRAGRYVRLTIADNGCGIAAADLERVALAFFTTRADGGGTGLGLATASEFASDVGGCLELESTPGVGTRVDLFLPLDRSSSDVLSEWEPSQDAPVPRRSLA